MEQTIGGVTVVVPISETWYSGRSGGLGLYIRAEAEIVSLYTMNLHVFSTSQSIFGNTAIENVTFGLSVHDEASKTFSLDFGPELMNAFAGTVVTSITGKWNSNENAVYLSIGITYGWMSFSLNPVMANVQEPFRSAT